MNINWNLNRNNNYDHSRAVLYAKRYAEAPNPDFRFFDSYGDGGGDCSNFVSQCLLAGGVPMDFSGISPWWYKNNPVNKNGDRWSLSWSVANTLYLCLKTRAKRNLPGLYGVEVESFDFLEPGDIIQYENFEGRIYHSSIITDFALNNGIREPLISQHSFNAINTSYFKPKAVRMHLMKIYIK